jgi:predicted membrane-bound spermidine synthase
VTPPARQSGFVLVPVFLISGFAAILYQLVWQRALFRLLGSSMESVTLIVTAFMLGLGLGSLAGGAVSTSRRVPLPLMFGAVELGIGAFGFVSMPLFTWIASETPAAAGLSIGVIAFLAVLVPTLLMGGTLPILVASLVDASGNVGRSVGLLYFVNTLGSALGSLAAAAWVLGALGQRGTVTLAAAINVAVAAAVVAGHLLGRRRA